MVILNVGNNRGTLGKFAITDREMTSGNFIRHYSYSRNFI